MSGAAPRGAGPARSGLGVRVARVAAIGLALAGLAVLAAWPLPVQWGDMVLSRSAFPDVVGAVWHPWHVAQRLLAGDDPFLVPGTFWPDGQDTSLFLFNLGTAVLQAPFYLLAPALQAHAAAILALTLLNIAAGFALGREVGRGSSAAGLAGACVVAFAPFPTEEMLCGRCEQGVVAFVLLAFAGLLAIRRGAGWGAVVATGLSLAAAGACYWFYAGFIVLAVAVVAPAWAALRRLDRARWARLGLALALAAVLVLPLVVQVATAFLQPDVAGHGLVETSRFEEETRLRRLRGSLLPGSLLWPWADRAVLTSVLLPMGLLGLLPLGLLPPVRRLAGFLPWMAAGALLLALGPVDLPLWPGARSGLDLARLWAALDHLPLVAHLWWPGRLLVLFLAGTCGLAAAVVATPRAPALRWGALAVIAAVLGCEHSLIVGPARRLDPALLVEAPPPFFAELARQPGRHPLLQLPLAGDGYLLWVPYHRQPVDGGIADGDPYLAPQAYAERLAREPVLAALGRLGRGETVAPMPDAETRICALGFHYAVLHARGAVPAGTVAHCRAALPDFFGRAPDRSEGLIQVWRMRPCAGDGP